MAAAAPRLSPGALWFGAGAAPGAPAAAALALLSGEVGAALGLAGRCGDSTQLGKATVARFQARHGSPGMGQNRCAVRKAAIKGFLPQISSPSLTLAQVLFGPLFPTCSLRISVS